MGKTLWEKTLWENLPQNTPSSNPNGRRRLSFSKSTTKSCESLADSSHKPPLGAKSIPDLGLPTSQNPIIGTKNCDVHGIHIEGEKESHGSVHKEIQISKAGKNYRKRKKVIRLWGHSSRVASFIYAGWPVSGVPQFLHIVTASCHFSYISSWHLSLSWSSVGIAGGSLNRLTTYFKPVYLVCILPGGGNIKLSKMNANHTTCYCHVYVLWFRNKLYKCVYWTLATPHVVWLCPVMGNGNSWGWIWRISRKAGLGIYGVVVLAQGLSCELRLCCSGALVFCIFGIKSGKESVLGVRRR